MPLLPISACELMCFWERVKTWLLWLTGTNQGSTPVPCPWNVDQRGEFDQQSEVLREMDWTERKTSSRVRLMDQRGFDRGWRAIVALHPGLLRHFHINFAVRELKGWSTNPPHFEINLTVTWCDSLEMKLCGSNHDFVEGYFNFTGDKCYANSARWSHSSNTGNYIWNVGQYVPKYTTQHLTRQQCLIFSIIFPSLFR